MSDVEKVQKVPTNEVAPETGIPANRSILHADEVVPVRPVAEKVNAAQKAVEEAADEFNTEVVQLSREAAITGDTHVEVDGEVIPLVPEDQITTLDKVHADPAPTTRD